MYEPFIDGHRWHYDVEAKTPFEAAWKIACEMLSPGDKEELCIGFKSIPQHHYVATLRYSQTMHEKGTETTRMCVDVKKEKI